MSQKHNTVQASVCLNCGGRIDINAEEPTSKCLYCGTEYPTSELLGETEEVKIAKLKAETEQMRLKAEMNAARQEDAHKFRKGFFSKVLIIFTAICLFWAILLLADDYVVSGVIALVQAVLAFTAWLMGMQIIKIKNTNVRTVLAATAFLLTLPFIIGMNCTPDYHHDKIETLVWDNIILNEALPEPDTEECVIYSNSQEGLSMYIIKAEKEDFTAYVEKCKKTGFTLSSKIRDDDFEAFNEDGYNLRISYWEESREYSISLEPPVKLNKIIWPISDIGKAVPEIKDCHGEIVYDIKDSFSLKIGNTTAEQYAEYVQTCIDSGFSVDYQKGDDYFRAKNADGYYVSLSFDGFSAMTIAARTDY